MEPKDQRQRLSEAEDTEFVVYLGEDAQEVTGKGLLSMGGNKPDRVPGTEVLLTSNHVQCIDYIQQFIDEATTLSKKYVYKVVFTDRSSKAYYEQDATPCVEATA